jgi:GAF domain-containing protein
VCATVTEEVGRLLGADVASMIRYEGGHGTIVAGWSGGSTPPMTVGYRVVLGKDSTAARIHRTGLPARVDTYDQPGEAFATLRALGVRASVGAPIVVDGELWGAVVVASTHETPFPAGAEERVAGFAELVAQALANAEAREQLAASRKRLVEAAQAERRRLERNLHDGAQQRLARPAPSRPDRSRARGGAPATGGSGPAPRRAELRSPSPPGRADRGGGVLRRRRDAHQRRPRRVRLGGVGDGAPG